jgi:hypothetical protein
MGALSCYRRCHIYLERKTLKIRYNNDMLDGISDSWTYDKLKA